MAEHSWRLSHYSTCRGVSGDAANCRDDPAFTAVDSGALPRRCNNGEVADKKPRILQNNKDMAWSLIPLILACLVIAAIAGQCSLRVGGPEVGEIPRVDAGASLQADADSLPFPIRSPRVPDGWIPNSASRPSVTGSDSPASIIGFVTVDTTFLSLTQSDASEQDLVRYTAGDRRISPSGAETISDVDWVVYGGEDSEPVWVADLGDSRVAITGSGSQDDFVALATATATAPELDPR